VNKIHSANNYFILFIHYSLFKLFIMKLFGKILRVLEIAIPFLKMVLDQFKKDKDKPSGDNPKKVDPTDYV